ncbi:MAG: hypothetical protein IJT30_10425 [Muribaculaceae bacterium]|nr:hypothetical protein [Muribaculaceae bacterium]
MKRNYNRLLSAALIAAAAMTGLGVQAQEPETIADNVFIEDFSIKPGESRLAVLNLDNSCWWNIMFFEVSLPAGLELETLNPEELDPEAFTLETIGDPDASDGFKPQPGDKCLMAMSTNFANRDFMDRRAKVYCETMGETYATRAELHPTGGSDGKPLLYFFGDGHICFNGKQPMALLKLRATDELANEAVIHIDKCVFVGQGYVALGEDTDTQLGGTPTECRVRRVDLPSAISDIDAAPERGDGVYYNLLGQPVTDPAPGIYVRNGKKVLVK